MKWILVSISENNTTQTVQFHFFLFIPCPWILTLGMTVSSMLAPSHAPSPCGTSLQVPAEIIFDNGAPEQSHVGRDCGLAVPWFWDAQFACWLNVISVVLKEIKRHNITGRFLKEKLEFSYYKSIKKSFHFVLYAVLWRNDFSLLPHSLV